MSSRTRQRLSALLGLGLAVTGLQLVSSPTALANPAGTGLVINEVYGGGGNSGAAYTNDFIELHNPSASPISVGGLSLQYRAAGGSGAPGSSNVFALPNKTVQPGGYFLVQAAAGATVTDKPLPVTPDAQTTGTALNLSGTGGQIYLATGTSAIDPGTGTIANPAVIDFVGWGTTTTSYEGTPVAPAVRNAAPATANATSISRKTTGQGVVQDTDSNADDFATATVPSPSSTSVAEPLSVSDPGSRTGFVDTPLTVNLTANGGTSPYTWETSTLPAGLSLSGSQIAGSPTEAGSTEVTVTATDSASPTPGTASRTFTITVSQAPPIKTIAEVQGTGERSPFAPATGTGLGAETITIEGIVTGMYADVSWAGASSGYDGMYVQTAGTGGTVDSTPGSSDAIFVYGNESMPAGVAIGDSVSVTGRVSEFAGLTEITPGAGGVVELETPLAPVTGLEIAYPMTEAAREAQEGMLLAPTDTFTVTNSYATNGTAEVGLATGTTPLKQPSEYVAPSDAAGIQAIKDENAARAVTLDDGTSINYLQNQTNKAQPVPYLTNADGSANPIRVGAEATLESPVILEYRNNVWKFQPPSPVFLNGADVVSFEDTRAGNLAPQDVGGDLKIATFNVLNYFNTTGEAYAGSGPLQDPPIDTHCTYYTDRASNRIGNNSCGTRGPGIDPPNDGRGPRGAATAVSLARQEQKLTNTLISLDADIVGLEEVENSIKLPGETNRDDAVARIVELLNAQAGAGTWAYVRSPGEALTAAAVAEQDVIRGAFIYQVESVQTVGQSRMLFGTNEFANAREPLAQAFKAKGADDDDAFAVIVNHFKSKGDNASPAPPATGDNANDTVTGVGAFNGDRTRQAQRLVEFAEDFAAEREVEAVFLAGDFNAYSKEQPIAILEAGGFEVIESDQPGDESYSFSGLSGSLDHVLGNEAAMALVTGADIWEINANESLAFQYSRHNYNVTDFWQPELPFATSDHNPEIVGLELPDVAATPYKEVQVIGTNDFHGRLLPDAGNAAGAAPFASAIDELRAEVPNSIFVAAGDLVGASTFESFIQDDEPTIDALNEMGLEVSAAGNHEFDRGYEDLVGRIQDRAEWEYLAANVEEPAGRDELAETWTKTIDGVKVGFVGAVTEDLPALVAPAGIAGITVTDVVEATNAAATELRSGADPADVVVLLVHEGSPSTDCTSPSFTDPATVWGNIVQNTSADVDAIISGHTHLAYNCRFTVPSWAADEDRAVTRRPVVSAGQYGTNLNKLVFKFDEASDELLAISQDVIATAGVGYPADPDVQAIVDAAVTFAEEAGSEVLGAMDGQLRRARYLPAGTATENRGGESTLNNQVAEVQRWATENAGIETDIAFMNPGGLRADMPGTANGDLRDLTYRQAADVQPFANTLVNMELTGAQLETVLEQQWQRNAQGGVPSRPFLRLGTSSGFTYTYVEIPETVSVPNAAPVSTFRGEVTGMWLDGTAIDPEATYSVTVNSFLGGGGDNFWELANGTRKVDSGQVDLAAMVDYMAQYDAENPLPVDYSQRAVEVTFPGAAPTSYAPGDTVAFDVSSWAMSAVGDKVDTEIEIRLGGTVIGTAAVDNTIGAAPYDDHGTAAVSVTLPDTVQDGPRRLQLVGVTTGTRIPVPIVVDDGDGATDIQILATNDFHGRIQNDPTSAAAGAAVVAGAVDQLREANPNTVFAAAGDLIGASTFESFIQNDKPTIDALNAAGLEVSAVGNHELDQGYDDLIERVMAEGGAQWEYIAANLKIKATGDPAVPATWVKTMNGVDVGFVGAVTEDLPSLVSPAGIAELQIDPIVSSVNDATEDLKTAGADLVVMLVHEGSPSTSCATMTDPETAWGRIVTGVSDDVDAIVSGHTHLEYDCSFPVAGWSERPVKERPVVSSGQYGANLNRLVFSVDTASGEVLAKSQSVLKLKSCSNSVACTNYPTDAETAQIVADAVIAAEPLGAQVLGQLGGGLSRAKFANGVENRGGESTLGNLVAEVQRWATPAETVGAAQIAFMNPGGLRQDMAGTPEPSYPRDLTYRQAANVQSFANTLVNMDLTGAQIKTVLEQQWQRTGAGAVPTRAFLRLGVSKGFTYVYDEVDDPANPGAKKGVVTGMWLDGEPIDPAETYSVTVNSFLATGGDNFRELDNGANKQDTGKTDLQAMVEYLAEYGAGEDAIAVDYAQQAVGVRFPAQAPDAYAPGDDVTFDLYSLAMTGRVLAAGAEPGFTDPVDTEVSVSVGGETLGTFPVSTDIGTAPDNNTTTDEAGTASVDVALPDDLPSGPVTLTVTGTTTGTEFPVIVQVASKAASGIAAEDVALTWGQAATVTVTLDEAATGTVQLLRGSEVLASAPASDGVATLSLPARSLEPGTTELTASYSGDDAFLAGTTTLAVAVAKATTAITVGNVSLVYGKAAAVRVTLDPTATGSVQLRAGTRVIGSAPVAAGVATVRLPAKSLTPGRTTLSASYSGDGHFLAASAAVVATVAKAKSTSRASARPAKVVVKRTKATVTVTVRGANGVKATGRVRITVAGQGTKVVVIKNGRATRKLKAFTGAGRKAVTVTYLGSALLKSSKARTTITVRKR